MIVASKYVQKIINDENLAWGKSLENKPEKFLLRFSLIKLSLILIIKIQKRLTLLPKIIHYLNRIQ